MKRILFSTVLACLVLVGMPASSLELSNFVTPYGFRAPLLKQGQYVLNLNSHYYKSESEYDTPMYVTKHSESTWRTYYLSLNGVYAVTDQLIFTGSFDMYPAQISATRRRTEQFDPYIDRRTYEYRDHSSFNISPRLNLSFRPEANMELYGTFYFNREKLYTEDEDGERTSDERREAFYFDFGVTILGNL